ncbi:MAG TPA: universal stress protein [Polyangiaceae bacterium]|jgi:nucleotide-binding universal stress UspA family protein
MASERWIVVGTDFSDGARHALMRALDLAQDSHLNVALVHAYEDAPGAPSSADPTSKLLAQLAQEIFASGATRRGINVAPFVRRGPPWDKILNVATEQGAEVIVVGRSGQRGAVLGFPLGSVASRVLALSTRCVLVAPSSAASRQVRGAQ